TPSRRRSSRGERRAARPAAQRAGRRRADRAGRAHRHRESPGVRRRSRGLPARRRRRDRRVRLARARLSRVRRGRRRRARRAPGRRARGRRAPARRARRPAGRARPRRAARPRPRRHGDTLRALMPPSRPFADLLNRLRKGAKDDERARLTAILALNRALAKAGDLKALLTLLLDEAIALFGAERAFLVTGDGDEGGLTVEVARSLDKEAVKAPERKISRTIVARCMRERTGVFVADAREGDFSAIQSVADLKLRSV